MLWLAIGMAFWGALAPSLSHALVLVSGNSAQWVAVCSSEGMRWVALAASERAPVDLPSGSTLNHCPLCLLSPDRVVPAPHPWVHLFALFGDYPAATVRQAFFFVIEPTLGPLPRGPPAFS